MLQNSLRNLADRDSGWNFKGEDGGALEIGVRAVARLGVTVGAGRVQVERASDSADFSLRYGRAGVAYGLSLVPVPFNVSGSVPFDQVAFGKIYKGPNWRAGRTLELNEITGIFMWVDVAADFGPGYGVSIMYMNPIIPAVILSAAVLPGWAFQSAIMTAKAFAVFGSASASFFPGNVGATLTFGRLWR